MIVKGDPLPIDAACVRTIGYCRTRRLPPKSTSRTLPFGDFVAQKRQETMMSDAIVVGLLGITHPHASARVRALREIDGVEVVAAADDDSSFKDFTDKY